MHILFLTHYFPPEGNAPARRVFEITRRWVKAGHQVTVITCAPNVPNGIVYEGYRNRLRQEEVIEGIRVVRVWTYLAPNRGTVRRTLNYLSYTMSAAIASLFVKKPDVLIATSPQFFCGWAGVIASRLRRVPLVLEIRDLWPESIAAVGALRPGLVLRLLARMERAMYRASHLVVTVGESYKQRLLERGLPREKVVVVSNGVETGAFEGGARDEDLVRRYGLENHFVCAAIGTIGMASGLDVVLRAARRLKDKGEDRFRFLLVGDGAVRQDLERRARAEGLEAVVFAGLQPHERIPAFMAAADACLVHLRRTDLFRSVLPSKMLEAMAAAKPIVLGVEGAAASLLQEAGGGLCIEPENEVALIAALEKLAQDPAAAAAMGQSGRAFVREHFDLDARAAQYLQVVRATVDKSGSGSRSAGSETRPAKVGATIKLNA